MFLTNIKAGTNPVHNTEIASRIKRYGWWPGFLLVPKNWTLTAAQIAVFTDSIKAALIADNPDSRIYKVGKFHTMELNYGDQNVITHPDGSEEVTRAATAGWRGITNSGGAAGSQAFLSFDGREAEYNIVHINDDGSFVGTRRWNTTTNAWEFAGLDLSKLNVETPMVGDPSDIDRYPISWKLDNKDQLFVDGWIIDTAIDPFGAGVLPGVTEVWLTQLSALNGTGGFTLGMSLGCGAINLAAASNAATWANVARINVFNFQTGAAITKTSMAVNTGATGFDVDVDHTDTDYPASGEYIAVELVAISTNASAAGLKYYDSFADNPQVGTKNKYLLIKVP